MSTDDNNYMKAYSLNSSEQKIKQVQIILERKFGEGWRKTLFMVLVVIVATIALIIFGINTSSSTYNKAFSHLKVFFIVLLVSISFFLVWASIKPTIINDQTGIVPFPPGDTLVPVDQTQCGIIPLECTNEGQSVCEEKCTKKGNSSSFYGCREVKHPNTYYLGTKLEVGKKYCLPQVAQYDSVSKCGTYTGRIVWSQNPDGTLGWRCQCLYPGVFSGDDCTQQMSCMTNDQDRNPPPLKDKDGNVWSSSVSPPSNTTPYDSYEVTENGKTVKKTRFKCSCPSGFYSTDDDPFSCNKDICYAGEATSSVSNLDLNTMKCKCDNQTTYKSNISGFCYPIEKTDKFCNLNVFGDGCMYGINLFNTTENPGSPYKTLTETEKRIVFKNKDKYYISDLHNKSTFVANDLRSLPPPSASDPNYPLLIDITDVINKSTEIDKNNIIDLTNTILKDAFYSFPIKPSSQYSRFTSINSDLTSIVGNINDSDSDKKSKKDNMRKKLENIVINSSKNSSTPGIATLCNSYYYRRPGMQNCKNPLSKTGVEPIFTFDITNNIALCGTSTSKPIINLENYPYGYNCDCGNRGRKQPPDIADKSGEKPNICFECIPPGEDTSSINKCCNIAFDQYGRKLANFRGYDPDTGYVSFSAGFNKDKDGNIIYKCPQNPGDYCTKDTDCAQYKSTNFVCGWKAGTGFYKNDSTVCCESGRAFEKDAFMWCSQLGVGEKCKYNSQCANGKCGRMGYKSDESDDNPICCPSDDLLTKTFDWCANLNKGQKCKHDGQCKSGKCAAGPTQKECQ
jgi:hypothetical protein